MIDDLKVYPRNLDTELERAYVQQLGQYINFFSTGVPFWTPYIFLPNIPSMAFNFMDRGYPIDLLEMAVLKARRANRHDFIHPTWSDSKTKNEVHLGDRIPPWEQQPQTNSQL